MFLVFSCLPKRPPSHPIRQSYHLYLGGAGALTEVTEVSRGTSEALLPTVPWQPDMKVS